MGLIIGGSPGTIPLESQILGRHCIGLDLNPYALALTQGKLSAPPTSDEAIARAELRLRESIREVKYVDVTKIPQWVRSFFHPRTLKETVSLARVLREEKEDFLFACLLGILHHQRPGFLSYPASHLVPYLRTRKFPPEKFPDLYRYRDVRTRLLNKIHRIYRRTEMPANWEPSKNHAIYGNACSIPLEDGVVDAVITSPPYIGALTYARDNRLRLWFIGCDDWNALEQKLTPTNGRYTKLITAAMQEIHRVLKAGGFAGLVLGEVRQNGKKWETADIALRAADGGFNKISVQADTIPDSRRSRRNTKTTLVEKILIIQKK